MCIGLAGGALGLIPMAGNMFTMASTIAQGVSDSDASKQQAKALEAEGRSAVMAGNDQASEIRAEGARIEGSNRASLAASGVDLGSASAQMITEENARKSERDALLGIYGGQITKHARDYEAKQVRAGGRMSLINSGLKVGGQMLGNVAKQYGKN